MATLFSTSEFEQLFSETDTIFPDLSNFSLTHADLIDEFGDAEDFTAVSLASNRIALSATTYFFDEFSFSGLPIGSREFSIIVTGAGISPVSTLAALEQAVMDGLAAGNLNQVQVRSGGLEFLRLDITPSGYTLTSGEQVVEISGSLPSSLEDIGAIATAIADLSDAFFVQDQQVALDQLIAELRNFDFDSLVLRDAGRDVGKITASGDRLEIDLQGYNATAFGNFSGLLDADINVDFPEQSTGFQIDSFVVTNPSGVEIASIRDIADLDDLSDGFRGLLPGPGDFRFGFDGDDLMSGTGGDDVFVGLLGNDTLIGFFGDDVLDGNEGSDSLSGGGGDDLLFGGDGNDTLLGGDGDDDLNGGDGDDLISTGENDGGLFGFDFVSAGFGNDTVDMSDIVDGYVGIDYGTLNGTGNAITVTIDGGANTGTVDKGAAGVDTLINVANPLFSGWTTGGLSLRGTDGNDTFNLTPEGEQWMSVRGQGGNNAFNIAGTGQVRLDYSNGFGINANLSTGVVSDNGQGGVDQINGNVWEVRATSGNDAIIGSAADETFILREGNDIIDGGGGFDRLRYDRVGVESAIAVDWTAGTVTGRWNGEEFLHNFTSIEWMRGSQFDDVMVGDDESQTLSGEGGNDTLTGGAGSDRFSLGNNSLRGDSGGTDVITDFEIGVDVLNFDGVSMSNAEINAAFANAVNTDNGAAVVLNGTTVVFQNLTAADVITLDPFAEAPGTAGPTGDVVLGTDGNDTLIGNDTDDTIAGGAGDDSIDGGGGNDNISASDGNDAVNGGPGNDSIGGGLGNDTIDGGDGDDIMGGGFGDDSVSGGLGNDVVAGGAGNDTLDGGDGNDSMSGSFGNDLIDAGDGADDIGGGTGRDTIDAGAGNDRVGGGEGDDSISGGAGNDFLAGGGRNDTIDGGAGNDTINAGAGNDVITGGADADQFVFASFFNGDADVITDFEDGIDSFFIRRFDPDTGLQNIDNGGNGLAGFVTAMNITDTAAGALMSVNGNTIHVEGITAAQLTVDDFTFL